MDILDLSTDLQQAYFATYLNMAQNNVFITMKDIVERLCLKQTFFKDGKEIIQAFERDNCKDATILQDVYLVTLSADKQEQLKRKLLRSFPFLVPMISTDRFYAFFNKHELYYANEQHAEDTNTDVTIRKEDELLKNSSILTIVHKLQTTLNVLSFYRNNASHTMSINDDKALEIISDSNKTAIALDCVFKQACGVIKERFSLKGNEHEGANLQFIHNARVTPKYTGKKDQKIQVPNFDYAHCFYYKNNEEYTMSRMAVVYLICMFIEKSYATQFFSQIGREFYKGIYKNENYKMYMREIYSCYRIRMPKNTTNPYEDNVMLAMDILNEITKCPNELFNCLNRKDQQKFEKETTENSDFPERVLLRRSADRFPELALKWIDSNKVFNKLRFNVIYGKYHDIFKDELQETPGEKKCCDGIKRKRWLSKELTAFGRIDELEKQRTDKALNWDGIDLVKKFEADPEADKPWITDMRCQYVIGDGSIGIKMVQGNTILPSIKGKELKEIKTPSPDFLLSVYELPALVFLTILKPDVAENLIVGYREKYVSFLNKLKNGEIQPVDSEAALKEIIEKQGFEWKNIPEKIKKYLLKRRANFTKYAKKILDDEIQSTKKIIKNLADCKKGSENVDPKRFLPGKIAKWLTVDIVYFCKYEVGSDKPTGMNYNVMQSKLATFAKSNQFDDILQMFNSLDMCKGGVAEHPFLDKVLELKPKNVEQFFGMYLKEKKAYLEEVQSQNQYKTLHFLHPNKRKWQEPNIVNLVNDYLKLPLQLPKGLFDAVIKSIISKDCPTLKENDTTSYMINAYMHSKDDDIQEFYKFCRTYPVFEKLDKVNNGEIKYRTKDELHFKTANNSDQKFDSKDLFKQELAKYIRICKANPKKYRDFDAKTATTKLNHLFNNYDNTEKAITRYSVQDFLLMLIAEKLLLNQQIKKDKKRNNEKIEISIDSFKLKGIAPDSDKGLLSETVEIPIQLPKPNGYTVTWTTKIKDYSRIYKLYNDRRFLSLLGLLPKGNYPAEDIMREFENYDRNCIEAFKRILNFERKALKITSVKAANDQYVAENGRSNFYTILDALLNHLGFCGAERDKYLMINYFRDKYAHYQYPEEGLTLTSLKDASNKMFDKLNDLVDEINNKI